MSKNKTIKDTKEKALHKKIRDEFKIDFREYYYLCFEGSYVPEIIEFAIKEQQAKIKELEKEVIKYKSMTYDNFKDFKKLQQQNTELKEKLKQEKLKLFYCERQTK